MKDLKWLLIFVGILVFCIVISFIFRGGKLRYFEIPVTISLCFSVVAILFILLKEFINPKE
ncbi:MAG: hypothetical protein GY861_09210 [bacterium]|nr:hypothetical protein [bacterium]